VFKINLIYNHTGCLILILTHVNFSEITQNIKTKLYDIFCYYILITKNFILDRKLRLNKG